MGETNVTWADVEPWFEDLDDWFALGLTPPQLHSNSPFPAWKLALTIRSQTYVEHGEAGEADDTVPGLPNGTICPRELATRLRELLDIIQTASVSSNRQLWTEIVSHEWGPLDKSWNTVDQSLPCHQQHFWLCFKCETSRDHIVWLGMFVDEFFRPMNELATLPEFREIMSKMSHNPVHAQFEGLDHCQSVPWSRHIRIWMMDTTSTPRGPAAVADLVEWISKTCALFRWQLDDVLQFEHYPNIQHQTCIHARNVPVSTVMLGVLPQSFYRKRSSSYLMDGSISSSVRFHRTYWSEVYASYCWTPATADVTNRPFLLYVDGATSAKGEGAILPQVYELLMQNSILLKDPALSDDVAIVSRASLVGMFAMLTACSDQNEPHVDLILCSNEDSGFELEVVIVRFPLDGAAEAAGKTKLRLRFEDDEDCDEPLEIFLMRLIGPYLREYHFSLIPPGYESVFYETMTVYCPNLKELTHGYPMVSFGEMVATSKRLKTWTIQHLGFVIDDEVPIDIFLDALCDSSHPISRTLSYVEVFSVMRYGDTSAKILQIFQAIPRIHFPCTFHFDILPQLRAIIHDPFEDLRASGAFEYIVTLDSSTRLAILSVMSARGITMERGIVEEILAFAATRMQHEVTFSPLSESRLNF